MTFMLIYSLFVACWVDDWPEWGGPARAGISAETNLIDTWPEQGPEIRYRVPIGQGYSGIAVVGDKVVTLGQDLWGQYLYCLDRDTGRQRWKKKLAPPFEPAGIYPGPRATPAIDRDRIYVVTPEQTLFCMQLADGKIVWQISLKERFQGKGTEFGYSASARILDGKIILPVGGPKAAVVAFDPIDGQVIWQTGDEPASYCSVQPIEIGNTKALIAYLQNSLLIIRVSDGQTLWRKQLSSGYDEHSVIPLVDGNQFIVSAPFKAGSTCYRVDEDSTITNAWQVTNAWSSKQFSLDIASGLLQDGVVFGFDVRDQQSKAHRPTRGEFRCLDARTGNILWSNNTIGHATIIAADQKLILFNDKGELILAWRDASRYREIGRASVFPKSICWTAPSLANGLLFLRNSSDLVCIDLRADATPNQSKLSAGSRVTSSWWHDWTWFTLLQGEREHPFMKPAIDELAWWFLWSTATLSGSLLIGLMVSRLLPNHPAMVAMSTAQLGMLMGFLVSPIANQLIEPFVFTWPAMLFNNLLMIFICWHAHRGRSLSTWQQIQTRIVLLCFIAVCVGYYFLLHRLSLPHEWAFLLGYVPAAWPTSMVASRMTKHGITLTNSIGCLLAFIVMFWTIEGCRILQERL